MISLDTLKVRNARGIAGIGPDISLGGKSLVLLGDNATGKSSYIDALEYLITRVCTSLDIGRQGVKWADGGIHILANPSDFTIEAKFLGENGAIFPLNHTDDLCAVSGDLGDWLKAAQQRCFLLRRRTLLNLIEATPQKRYEALSSFFALDRYSKFEGEVKGLLEDVEAKSKASANRVTIQEDTLRRAFAIAPGANLNEAFMVGVLNQRLKAAKKDELSDLKSAAVLQVEVANEMKTFSGVEHAAKLETVLYALGNIPTIRPTIEALEALVGGKTQLEKIESRLSKGFSAEVLERGKRWIIDDNLDYCPLCEQPLEEKAAIMARIDTRIQESAEVIAAKRTYEIQFKLCSDLLLEIGKACASAYKTWEQKLGQVSPILTEKLATLRKVAKENVQGAPVEQLQGCLASLREMSLDESLLALAESLKKELAALSGIEHYKNLSAANQALSTLLVSWPAFVNAQRDYLKLQGQEKVAKKLLGHAIQARKDTVQAILHEIAAEANRIYLFLHPEEKVGAVSLEVPKRGQGSVEMETEFFGKRGDARLYFSESHLDTLGVSLFLALRKKQATADPHFKLLVLDDVFHSVDAKHRQRAARLIINEFRDHQFIITTHDPIWFMLLQEAVAASGIRENVIFKRISAWSLEKGPLWGDHEAEYEFLSSDKIDTAQPSDIAAKAGRLLEEMLKPLCDRLRISMPFRHMRRYDLGALWQPFLSRARSHQGFAAAMGAVLEEIELTDWVRNEIGAHSNPSSAPTTMEEAKRFAMSVVKLYNATRDMKCGQFIQEVDAPNGNWVCRCGNLIYTKKLTP